MSVPTNIEHFQCDRKHYLIHFHNVRAEALGAIVQVLYATNNRFGLCVLIALAQVISDLEDQLNQLGQENAEMNSQNYFLTKQVEELSCIGDERAHLRQEMGRMRQELSDQELQLSNQKQVSTILSVNNQPQTRFQII